MASAGPRAAAAYLKTYGFLLLALILECTAFEIIARTMGRPPFLSLSNAILILNQSAIYGVVAVGATYVILSGGIDLSVGSLVAFGGVIGALVSRQLGDASWLATAAGAVAAMGCGAATGTVAAFFIVRFKIPPFIATLALMSSVRGFGYQIVGGSPVSQLSQRFQFLGNHRVGGLLPVAVILLLGVFVAGGAVLKYTRFGRYVRAIGGNEETARLSGVPVGRIKWGIYALSGTLAALGGVVLASRMNSGDPNVGLGDELQVIAAVVVGGTSLSGGRGSLTGTLLGLLIIAVLYTGLNWVGVQSFGQQVILGIVILAAVLMDKLRSQTGT
ncbi:MAG: hypothetical protein AMXMBFR84_02070 [Candidatus Hydrogenedentota bacterium]